MLKLSTLIVGIILTISITASGQTCSYYMPLVTGTTYEYQILRGKNLVPFGTFNYKVISAETSTKGVVNTIQVRKNGKPIKDSDCNYYIDCTQNSLKIKADSTDFPTVSIGSVILPNPLEVGQTIPEVTTPYYFDKRRPSKQVGAAHLYNIKVTKKEMVEVPLGKFEAYLIEYDRSSKIGTNWMNTNFLMMIPVHYKDWYAPGKGFIKSERYMGKSLQITITLSATSNATNTASSK